MGTTTQTTGTATATAPDPFAAAAAGLRAPLKSRTRRRRSPLADAAPVAPAGERTAVAATPLPLAEQRSEALTAPTPAATSEALPDAAADRLAAAVAAIIAPLGVPAADQRDAVCGAVQSFLESRDTPAEIVSMRYGVLTLAADPTMVTYVRCDAAEIAQVCTDAGLELRDVRVRTRRS